MIYLMHKADSLWCVRFRFTVL